MHADPSAAIQSWWPNTTDPLKAALAYHNAGLCVIPLDGKRPALSSWKQYQKERPTELDIRRWAREEALGNLGIVCGPVSDNVVVLDFDGLGAYAAFATIFPDLAESFTVATGSGKGKHVYLRGAALPATTRVLDTPLGHIELRSSGTYVAAPPSIHSVTNQRYVVENRVPILRVEDLNELVQWIKAFQPMPRNRQRSWHPPTHQPPGEITVNPAVVFAIANRLRQRSHKERGAWINCSCVFPESHKNGDKSPSFGFNTASGYGYCYRCGTILAKEICAQLDVDPRAHGGLIAQTGTPDNRRRPTPVIQLPPTPGPADEEPPSLSDLELPTWLAQYVNWASQVGNQTPETFHLGMGIWMAAVAITRRVYTDARWGTRIHPNLYMMFIADTTFYRKTTAYKLGEQILVSAIPHLLMPTPGSPERFQDALAGHAPSNFDKLPQEHQGVVLQAMKFAAQRGLFKDEIAGLFGSFKRDYMSGMKDFLLEVYDCPDYIAKETQSGLAIIRNAAPSILGVTTPAGLSGAISIADFDNGLLPRFALLTPESDYIERPTLAQSVSPPPAIQEGLVSLYEALPMPQKSEMGWDAAQALRLPVESWEGCMAYSNHLRQKCDPRRDTPLDDRLKGIYGRLHVQAMKVAMICATLDWVEKPEDASPSVRDRHWHLGQAIAEHWRVSAHRLVRHLDRSGMAREESRLQDRILGAIRKAGAEGVTLHTVYKNHNLQAAVARGIAKDLVQAGQIVETRIGRAEAYIGAEFADVTT